MNRYLLFLLAIIFSNAFAIDNRDTCISTNCDIYRDEKAKFQTQLTAIHCTSETDTSKDCDQSALSKLSTDYGNKINSIFSSSNVSPSIKNDIQFNSLTNNFATKKQNVPGYYELIPVLSNPNIGVHWGGVANNAAQVDRLYNIDPNSPDVKNSNWYLTQWKKESPLMLNSTRRDSVSKNGPTQDSYLGKSLFEINSPPGKFGIETSILIFKNPADNSNVFEITGRNGWLDNVGGSNVFLTGDLSDNEHNQFDSDINLTFNGKISKMKAQYNDGSAETKNEVVVGQAFSAFTALYNPGDGGPQTNIFVQIFFGDTRGKNILYTGCYLHGESAEIVYTHNLDNDFATAPDSASAPLKPKKYNLNKYLCNALKQKFSCPSSIKKPDFVGMSKNLKNWRITSFYSGVETQASKATSADKAVIKGQVEMALQYSNMRVTANTNLKALDCETLLNRPVTNSVDVAACSKGSFKSGKNTIDFSCGCGDVPGAIKQADGCYHKISNGQPVDPTNSTACSQGKFSDASGKTIEFSCGCGAVAGGVKVADGCYHKVAANQGAVAIRNPALPNDPGICTNGIFTDRTGKLMQYSCGCGVIKGAALQGDGCYQKTAKKTAQPPKATFGSFCVGANKVNWICNAGDQGEGWKDAGKGCYHQPTNNACY